MIFTLQKITVMYQHNTINSATAFRMMDKALRENLGFFGSKTKIDYLISTYFFYQTTLLKRK